MKNGLATGGQRRTRRRASHAYIQKEALELAQFREHFEELAGAVCDAAQYGPTPKLEGDFGRERAWVAERLGRFRARLRLFFRPDREEGPETFELLIAANSLDELLATDNGSMISRITRTREALIRYGDHLRLLAMRAA